MAGLIAVGGLTGRVEWAAVFIIGAGRIRAADLNLGGEEFDTAGDSGYPVLLPVAVRGRPDMGGMMNPIKSVPKDFR